MEKVNSSKFFLENIEVQTKCYITKVKMKHVRFITRATIFSRHGISGWKSQVYPSTLPPRGSVSLNWQHTKIQTEPDPALGPGNSRVRHVTWVRSHISANVTQCNRKGCGCQIEYHLILVISQLIPISIPRNINLFFSCRYEPWLISIQLHVCMVCARHHAHHL